MATWDDLNRYIHSNYKVASERPGAMTLVFDMPGGRSQLLLHHEKLLNDTEEWVILESPFAQARNVSLQKALEVAGNIVCGGAAIRGEHVVLRHSVPLATLDESERPLTLVTSTADRLEERVFG